MTSSWTTESPASDPMRKGLIERAKKRTVNEGKSPGVYIVIGNSSLGDQYPNYMVRQRPNGEWSCDCLSPNRTGGHTRSTCSHITGVLLRIEEKGEWTGPEGNNGDEGEGNPDERAPLARKERASLGDTPTPAPARKPSPSSPVFEQTHHPHKKGDPICEKCGEPFDTNSISDFRKVCADCRILPSLPPLLTGDQLWDLITQDPDWVPHPRQLTINHADPELPSKFQEFRPSQWEAIREIDAALDEDYKVVFVSAPTGSGKTLLAESIRRLRGTRAIYTCTTKTLQNQILTEFEYAKVIKGRNNYPTLNRPDLTTQDCNKRKASLPACQKCPGWSGDARSSWDTTDFQSEEDSEYWHCSNCHPWFECPYELAKMEAGQARLAVLNTAYFLAETNYVSNSIFRGRGLVLIDEADMLEEELMRFIEVNITARDRKMLGIGLPELKTKDESWVEWLIDEVVPATYKLLGETKLQPDLFGEFDIDTTRKKKKLAQLYQKVKSLTQKHLDPETGETSYTLNKDWIYTGYEKDKDGNYPPNEKVNVTFKPIHVRNYAREVLWSRGGQFVLMSATLISPAQMAEDLGLDEDEWTVVEVPSSFPVLQRPIIPRPVADVIAKKMYDATPLLIKAVAEIMDEHSDERILVHSVSYALTKSLFYDLQEMGYRDRLSTYFYSGDREGALDRYLTNPRGVLIAPSFDRGVDLPADDCRVVVVAKVPYLSYGDKQVQARLYGTGKAGRIWYAVQAIRSLCQMTGRGMRSEDDGCRTYILDKQFTKLYNENRRLFPKWWADAIVWNVNDPKWRGMA